MTLAGRQEQRALTIPNIKISLVAQGNYTKKDHSQFLGLSMLAIIFHRLLTPEYHVYGPWLDMKKEVAT